MYFKLKENVLFRKYSKYGYLADNSLFGYRFLNDPTQELEEKYVSESAAVMLETLGRIPQHIDDIVNKLLLIFIGVEADELKQDVCDFFIQLCQEGYLSYGKTFDECNNSNKRKLNDDYIQSNESLVENCSGKTFGEYDFLRSIHIEVASECNERCVHCYIPHECKDTFIDSNLFYKIIKEGRDMNIIHVTLSGGEPLLHKDIIKFLRKCRELDLAVNILTNLTLLNDSILEEMKLNPFLSVQTSLYSMSAEIHDSITKVKGSFEKTKNAILKLINAGIPVQISCPVMKQNKDTFQEVISWGKSKNIAVVFDYVIFASFDQSNRNLVNRLDIKDIENVFEKQLSDEYVNALIKTEKEKCALTTEDPICSICRYYFCVAANGDVFPCIGWQGNVVGNLNNLKLKDIWENSTEINRLRKIKRASFPKCLKCENRGFCTVCMMSNFNENGDIFKINDYHCKVAAMMRTKIEKIRYKSKKS